MSIPPIPTPLTPSSRCPPAAAHPVRLSPLLRRERPVSAPTPSIPKKSPLRPSQTTIPVDRVNDNAPLASRPAFACVRSLAPGRRGSLSGSRPATVSFLAPRLSFPIVNRSAQSPTLSTPVDPYVSTYRASPMEKTLVLVTTDAENLQLVDISGAMTSAFIRERIFTKVR